MSTPRQTLLLGENLKEVFVNQLFLDDETWCRIVNDCVTANTLHVNQKDRVGSQSKEL